MKPGKRKKPDILTETTRAIIAKQQDAAKEVVDKLKSSPIHPFPKKKDVKSLKAPTKGGIYMISDAKDKFVWMGYTPESKGGILQGLQDYMKSKKFKAGQTFQYMLDEEEKEEKEEKKKKVSNSGPSMGILAKTEETDDFQEPETVDEKYDELDDAESHDLSHDLSYEECLQNASTKAGVYVISGEAGAVIYVGSTGATGGIRQALESHIGGSSAFSQDHFDGNGQRSSDDEYQFKYVEVKDKKIRGYVKARAIWMLWPEYISGGDITKEGEKEERDKVKGKYKKLDGAESHDFSDYKQASYEKGVYVILNKDDEVYVGISGATGGILRQLQECIDGGYHPHPFTRDYLGGDGQRLLNEGYRFKYVEVENNRIRGFVKALAIMEFSPEHVDDDINWSS